MIQAGAILLNKYRIERLLGQGGMGVVALAQHLQLHQLVAIKFLLPEVLDKQTVVQRFLREAQASVRLKSEHVCRVIDVGTLETGAPYMVMEYLEGRDLDELLRAEGRVFPAVAVDFILQACEGLAEAHALGIVHRDIKPSNFFLTRRADGSALIKVLDFGISKTAAQIDENLTSTQSILGTPAYMSPEQLKASKYVDARADIWSLGVVLYQLLVGHRPFTASGFSELVIKVATEPAPLPEIALPQGLAEIVMRCLQKDPAARYQNVADLALALAPFAQTPSVAGSAVERTAGILYGPGHGSVQGAEGRIAAVARNRHGGFNPHTAVTSPLQASAAALPMQASPSTMSATSGEVVRAAPQVSRVDGPRRRPWLIAAVAALGIAGGIASAVVIAGGDAEPRDRPAATPAALDAGIGGALGQAMIDATTDAMIDATADATATAAISDAGVDSPPDAALLSGNDAAAPPAVPPVPGTAVAVPGPPVAPPRPAPTASSKPSKRPRVEKADKEKPRPVAPADDDILGTRQ